jgi:hypothetical protein
LLPAFAGTTFRVPIGAIKVSDGLPSDRPRRKRFGRCLLKLGGSLSKIAGAGGFSRWLNNRQHETGNGITGDLDASLGWLDGRA